MNLKKKKTVLPLDGWPAWFDGKSINEALFCQHFLKTHAIIYTELQYSFRMAGRKHGWKHRSTKKTKSHK